MFSEDAFMFTLSLALAHHVTNKLISSPWGEMQTIVIALHWECAKRYWHKFFKVPYIGWRQKNPNPMWLHSSWEAIHLLTVYGHLSTTGRFGLNGNKIEHLMTNLQKQLLRNQMRTPYTSKFWLSFFKCVRIKLYFETPTSIRIRKQHTQTKISY